MRNIEDLPTRELLVFRVWQDSSVWVVNRSGETKSGLAYVGAGALRRWVDGFERGQAIQENKAGNPVIVSFRQPGARFVLLRRAGRKDELRYEKCDGNSEYGDAGEIRCDCHDRRNQIRTLLSPSVLDLITALGNSVQFSHASQSRVPGSLPLCDREAISRARCRFATFSFRSGRRVPVSFTVCSHCCIIFPFTRSPHARSLAHSFYSRPVFCPCNFIFYLPSYTGGENEIPVFTAQEDFPVPFRHLRTSLI